MTVTFIANDLAVWPNSVGGKLWFGMELMRVEMGTRDFTVESSHVMVLEKPRQEEVNNREEFQPGSLDSGNHSLSSFAH